MDVPNLMQLKYIEIEGISIPANRRYKQSNWNADVTDKPWVKVSWTDIKFNNELAQIDFKLKSNSKND